MARIKKADELLTPKEAAKELGITRQAFSRRLQLAQARDQIPTMLPGHYDGSSGRPCRGIKRGWLQHLDLTRHGYPRNRIQ